MNNQNNGMMPNNNDNSRFMPGNNNGNKVNENVNNNVDNQVNYQMNNNQMNNQMYPQSNGVMNGYQNDNNVPLEQNNNGKNKTVFIIIAIVAAIILISGSVIGGIILFSNSDTKTETKESKKDDTKKEEPDDPTEPDEPTEPDVPTGPDVPVAPLPDGIEIVSERKVGDKIVLELKNTTNKDLYITVDSSFYDGNKKEVDTDMDYIFAGSGNVIKVLLDGLEEYKTYSYVIQTSDYSDIYEKVDTSNLSLTVTKESDYLVTVKFKNTLGVDLNEIGVCVVWKDGSKEVDISCNKKHSIKNNEDATIEIYTFNKEVSSGNFTMEAFVNEAVKSK